MDETAPALDVASTSCTAVCATPSTLSVCPARSIEAPSAIDTSPHPRQSASAASTTCPVTLVTALFAITGRVALAATAAINPSTCLISAISSPYLKMSTVPSETASSVPMPVTNSGWDEASIVPM